MCKIKYNFRRLLILNTYTNFICILLALQIMCNWFSGHRWILTETPGIPDEPVLTTRNRAPE